MRKKKKLGEMLREASLVSEQDLERALDVQRATGERLGSALLRLHLIAPSHLARVLADQFETEGVDPGTQEPSREALTLVPEEIAYDLGALPLRREDGVLHVALADPTDLTSRARLEQATGLEIKAYVAPQMALYRALKRHYAGPLSEARSHAIRQHLAEIRRHLAEVESLLGS